MESRRERGPQSRNWVFTLNNYTEAEWNQLWSMTYKYMVIGLEIGENGTPHLQGYVQFTNSRYRPNINPRVHWEPARGTPSQAADYCKKEGQFVEQGAISVPATEQWQNLITQIQSNDVDKNTQIYARYEGYVRRRMLELNPVHTLSEWDGELGERNFWYVGATGTGKSRSARRFAGSLGYYARPASLGKWWDGYNGEEFIIIEDWDPSHAEYVGSLKVWSDHYGFLAEIKGGTVPVPGTIVLIVTSQYTLEECFARYEDCTALARRFTVIQF